MLKLFLRAAASQICSDIESLVGNKQLKHPVTLSPSLSLSPKINILKFWFFSALTLTTSEECANAVGWGTALQAGRSRVRIPMVSLKLFYWHYPSDRTVALRSTQNLTKMSTTEYLLGGKGGRCFRLTTLPPACAECLGNLGASNSGSPKGLSRIVQGLFHLNP